MLQDESVQEEQQRNRSVVQALALPELLSMIFQCCGNHDLAMCAVVCKNWELSALQVLWRTIVDARHLFSLLGALTVNDGDLVSHNRFFNHINTNEWSSLEICRQRRFSQVAAIQALRSSYSSVPSAAYPAAGIDSETFREANLLGSTLQKPALMPNLVNLRHLFTSRPTFRP